jgi:ankyrin repeat protein
MRNAEWNADLRAPLCCRVRFRRSVEARKIPTVIRRLTIAALFVGAAARVEYAQVAGTVDFVRDVQPIFREHCVSCHGSEIQMNGLRLDRRADAMRGSTQTLIGPGNADGSKLYHRVAGTTLGPQMPPGHALTPQQIDTIKEWIDEGATWPDAASGEVLAPPVEADAERLIAAIRAGDRRAIDDLLKAPRAAAGRGHGGTTALLAAALYGDAALVRRLLAGGADPNAANVAGATALMWAVPDVGKMRLLLDAGADANARSEDHRSPILIASGIVGGADAVRLLLEYGADPFPWRASELSPLREAARAGDPDIFRVLLEYGLGRTSPGAPPARFVRTNCARCAAMIDAGGALPRVPPDPGAESTAPRYDPGRSARPTPIGPTPATPAAIHAAVERSLPLLQDTGIAFINQTGCVSCHHNSVVSMAVAAARAHGFRVDEDAATRETALVATYLESWRERTAQNEFIAGQQDTISYLLVGLGADGHPADAATDAQAIWLERRQAADGHWPIMTVRPPIESYDVTVTALSLRALQLFTPPSRRAEFDRAIDRARAWLLHAEAADTEELAFRLLGLSWSGAARDAVAAAAHDLLVAQRPDGGWAQTSAMGTDAYATGQALVALRESGSIAADAPAYRNGVEYLLRTQIDDGSWVVESRAVPIQAYFESGFPYGVNQWISAAATGWATTALALAR